MGKKTALVTGGAAGIGKAISMRLAKDGFDIAIGDIRQNVLEAVKPEIEATGAKCCPCIVDVSKTEQVNIMVDKSMEAFGRIDVLVNNAGICPIRQLDDFTPDDFRRTFDINVVSVINCTKAVYKIMAKQGKGKIINATSQSAFNQSTMSIEYGATKWALRGLTRSLALALAPYNITVNGYAPGKITTEMTQKIAEDFCKKKGITLEEYYSNITNEIPLKRMQSPEDVAALVAFLASDGADNISGQNIMVNAGQIMN